MNKSIRGSVMLLVTAMIWGTAFAAQSKGMDYVEPFTFNSIRTLLGGIVLVPVIVLLRAAGITSAESSDKASTVRGGLLCGLCLFAASSFQQWGISMTTAGKAGFITALYVVIVPLMELVLGKRVQKRIWLCVLLAVIGYYFLCMSSGFGISKGDMLVLAGAVFFAVHIIIIDRFTGKNADGVVMSCIQFFTAGTLMLIAMFITESPAMSGILSAMPTILYSGIMSCGAAYTLQILGQRHTPPALATLIMSLESVFAALSGWLILHEVLSARELLGCILVFIAVISAQFSDTAH